MFNFENIIYLHTLMRGKYSSTSSTRLFRLNFPLHPRSNCFGQPSQLTFFMGRTTEQGERYRTHKITMNPKHANHESFPPFPPTSYLYPTKVISMLFRAIPCYCTHIEECFSCVSLNIPSVHSPCYYFDIDSYHTSNCTTSSI